MTPSRRPARRRAEPTYDDTIPTKELADQCERWQRDFRMRGHTAASQRMNAIIAEKLLWYLRQAGRTQCGEDELSDFLLYAQEAHTSKYGRWGDGTNKVSIHVFKPLSRSTVRTYYKYLRVLFNWIVARDVMEVSPMRRLAMPEYRESGREGFSEDEFNALLQAAALSTNPYRNRALLLLMIDSGARASEICGIALGELDLEEQRVLLHGKGEKDRYVYVGVRASRALYDYLSHARRDVERDRHEPLFMSERGESLTRSGLLALFRRLRIEAGLRNRCYPHMVRRTFATEFLCAGAPIKDVQRQLGHTSAKQTMEYLYSSEARLKENHRRFSPADRMKKRK